MKKTKLVCSQCGADWPEGLGNPAQCPNCQHKNSFAIAKKI